MRNSAYFSYLTAGMRYCATPHCDKLVTHGHCDKHRRSQDVARGTRHARGYDNQWARYSKARLLEHPRCVGYPEGVHGSVFIRATMTDHILSVRLRPDLRLEPSNMQSLCAACNTRKAIAEEGGFGR